MIIGTELTYKPVTYSHITVNLHDRHTYLRLQLLLSYFFGEGKWKPQKQYSCHVGYTVIT